jgi:hypothetical protein
MIISMTALSSTTTPTAQDAFIARAISIFVNCHVRPVVEFPTPLDVACPVVHQALFTTSALPQSATTVENVMSHTVGPLLEAMRYDIYASPNLSRTM